MLRFQLLTISNNDLAARINHNISKFDATLNGSHLLQQGRLNIYPLMMMMQNVESVKRLQEDKAEWRGNIIVDQMQYEKVMFSTSSKDLKCGVLFHGKRLGSIDQRILGILVHITES